mgnify:CR=1 FL=1
MEWTSSPCAQSRKAAAAAAAAAELVASATNATDPGNGALVHLIERAQVGGGSLGKPGAFISRRDSSTMGKLANNCDV